MPDIILTPSQRFLLVKLLSHQRPDLMMGKQAPGLLGSYPVGAYRRLVQRGLLTDQGDLTPLGLQVAGEILGRVS
ncbi:hypothetical protein [Pseudonocardia alni]|uniref:hypothetical protein n=1 Tax=Pseudonocardia alni TaxID=33907 RepID=UPI00280A5BC2|nr:hypothetical protein [Pseudonocardia alni]